MSSNSIHCRCPQCGESVTHAILPVLSIAPRANVQTADSMGLSADHCFVCTACEKTWQAAIVPSAQLERLTAVVASLDDAKRQIAMLRLIMSKDQVERADKSREGVLKIHRAA